jgi:acyl-CoA thioester hydrolase
MNTGNYATYFVDHRMEGVRENLGWDLNTLATLPFMVWVRRLELEFLRPARGDQEITITATDWPPDRMALFFEKEGAA